MRVQRGEPVRQHGDARIYLTRLIIAVLSQQRLQVCPRMGSAIESSQCEPPTAWEYKVMFEGPLFPSAQGKQQAIASPRTGGLGGEEMPQLHRGESRLGPDGEMHG